MSRARGSRLGAGRVVRMRAGSSRHGVPATPPLAAVPLAPATTVRGAAPLLPRAVTAPREREPA